MTMYVLVRQDFVSFHTFDEYEYNVDPIQIVFENSQESSGGRLISDDIGQAWRRWTLIGLSDTLLSGYHCVSFTPRLSVCE